jgi:hypothetical protein
MTDISEIWKFYLRRGSSLRPEQGACLLDAVSWFEYGTLGDHPPCVCSVIAGFGRGINDALSPVDRQRLKAFLPRLPGTVDPNAKPARVEYLAWQAIRVFAPAGLAAIGLEAEAKKLREFRGTLQEAARAAYDAAAVAAVANPADAAAWGAAYAADAADAGAAEAVAAANYAAEAANSHTDHASHAAEAAAWSAAAAWGAAHTAHTAQTAHAAQAAQAAQAEIANAMIAAMEGVLAIGKQAEPINPERWETAQRAFSKAVAL